MNLSNLHSCEKKYLYRFVFISFGILLLFSSVSYAEKCPDPVPLNSQVYFDFDNLFKAEYHMNNRINNIQLEALVPFAERISMLPWIARGHLLGRLALGVQNQRDRKIIFDCVYLALEQRITNQKYYLDKEVLVIDQSKIALTIRMMMQAAMGMHNDVVATFTGVSSAEPIYDFFDGFIVGEGVVKSPHSDKVSKVDGDASASSSKGRCSNWMVSNLKDKDGLNRESETTAVCTSLEEAGDFKTEYEPKSKTCFICNISDWTPIPKGPTGTTASKVDGDTSGASGSVHPCADKTIPVSAHWQFYSQGYGGDGKKFDEKAGLVCKGRNGYETYSGSKWRTFSCDKGMVNCRLKKEYPIREIENKDKYTVYHYGKTGWGAPRGLRTPAN